MTARTLPQSLLDCDREAVQLCRKFQIRPTHDGVMLWRFSGEWNWFRPFKDKDQADVYLTAKLPSPPETRGDIIRPKPAATDPK